MWRVAASSRSRVANGPDSGSATSAARVAKLAIIASGKTTRRAPASFARRT